MKHLSHLLVFISIILVCQNSTAQHGDYIIRRGDVVDVVVMENPEFTLSGITVLPDGTIQYPGFGSVIIAGMTTQQLSDSLEKKLIKYVVNPVVSIFIRRLRDQNLNVMGYVNRPGQYEIFEATNILSAIGLAGGIKSIRKVKGALIIRGDNTTKEVNVKKLFRGELEDDELPLVYAGDTLYVLEPRDINWSRLSFFASLTTTILQVVRLVILLN